MMDLFHEESVQKVNTGLNVLIIILAWIGLILFGFLTLIMVTPLLGGRFSIPAIAGTVVFGGLTYLCFIVRNNQNIEYDYTFTNGTLDIAKVINNSRRKKLLTTNIKEFEVIAPTSDEGFMRMLRHPDIKKYNYFLNRGGGLYYGVFTQNGQKSILVFEPSDELVRLFKLVNPRNVKTN